jgi:hypothetical protein
MQSAKGMATKLISRSRSWVDRLARMGYAAKGIVYMMIGIMAIRFAFGERKQPGDFSSVLLKLFSEPFGRILLASLTIGLIGYGLWCLIQAAIDTENKGTNVSGLVIRVFYAGVGVVYLSIAWEAIQLLTNTSNMKEGDRPERQLTAELFALSPSTRWIAILAGVGFLGFCIYEIRRVYVEGIEILRPEGRKGIIDVIAMRIGQIGIIARALLFALIGIFLAWSGITFDPNKVRGISGALLELRRQTHGTYWLIAMALGLGAYGIYMWFVAWRRRINPLSVS